MVFLCLWVFLPHIFEHHTSFEELFQIIMSTMIASVEFKNTYLCYIPSWKFDEKFFWKFYKKFSIKILTATHAGARPAQADFFWPRPLLKIFKPCPGRAPPRQNFFDAAPTLGLPGSPPTLMSRASSSSSSYLFEWPPNKVGLSI